MKNKIAYICRTDWEYKSCWKDCGIIKVEIEFKEEVKEEK
jgi:hypothetical protein